MKNPRYLNHSNPINWVLKWVFDYIDLSISANHSQMMKTRIANWWFSSLSNWSQIPNRIECQKPTIGPSTQCLKITEKVTFNIPILVYIVNSQTVFPDRSLLVKNWWKTSKLKNQNETFWVIFKNCAFKTDWFSNVVLVPQMVEPLLSWTA